MADSSSATSQTSGSVPIKVVNEFVKQLCMTFSAINLYSWQHRATKERVSKGWDFLNKTLENHGDILLTVAGNRLMFHTEPVDEKNPGVRRLARHFDSYGVSSVSFARGMVADEYETFLRVFSMEPGAVQQQGGMVETLKKENVQNIKANSTVYRLISEDEKVVDVNAGEGIGTGDGTGDGGDGQPDDPEKQAMRAFVDEILQRTSDTQDMISKIAEEPDKVADQIAKILDFSEGALAPEQMEKMLGSLQGNIESAVAGVAAPVLRALPKQQQQLAKAFEKLEKEIRRKTQSLTSEKGVEFVKRMSDLVATSANTARADAVLSEFLQSDRSLTAAKKMLRSLSRSPDTSQQILTDLQKMTTERSVEAQVLLDMVQDDITAKLDKQKTGKPTTPLIDRVRDKIEKEYKDLPNKDDFVGYLETVISKEVAQLVRKETAQLREQLDRVETVLNSVEEVIGKIRVGVVALDEDGTVVSVIHSDMMPDFAKGAQLPQELLDALAQIADNTVAQYQTVRIIETHRGEDGRVNAFLFVPDEVGGQATEEPAAAEAGTATEASP